VSIRGLSLCLYGEDYRRHRRLSSAKASAEHVDNAIRAGADPSLIWVAENPVALVGDFETELKPRLHSFAQLVDTYAAEVVFLYIAGHGHYAPDGPRILARDSSPKVPSAGISVREVLDIVFGRTRKRLIAFFDICQTVEFPLRTPLASWKEQVEAMARDRGDLVLVMAASAGEVAFGGTPSEPSPFARALGRYFADGKARSRGARTIAQDLHDELGLLASEGVQRSIPVSVIHPDPEGSVFGVRATKGEETGGERSRDWSAVRKKIAERELESFRYDPYVSSPDDLWPMLVSASHELSGADLRTELVKRHVTQLVVGRSGSGKTLLAKTLSFDLATGGREVVPVYVNAARLEDTSFGELDDVGHLTPADREDAVISTLIEYLTSIRYDCGDELPLPNANFGHGRLQVIIDAIDEVRDRSIVERFLSASAEFLPVVAFAHADDLEWVAQALGIPAGYALPLSEHDPASHGLSGLYSGTLTPLEIQEALRHTGDGKSLPPARALERRLWDLSQAVGRQLGKAWLSEEFKRSVVFTHPELPREAVAMDVLQDFACRLLERGFVNQASLDWSFSTMRQSLRSGPHEMREDLAESFIDLFVRAGIARRADSHVRFEHRRTQSLLIAAAWWGRQVDQHSVNVRRPVSIWKAPVGLFATLQEHRFDWESLIKSNPLLALGAMEESASDVRPVYVEQLAETLLQLASRWTRGPAVGHLSRLPQSISDWLKNRYLQSIDIEKRVTICGVLSGHPDFLISAYNDALEEEGLEGIEYVRRRILESLKGSITVDHVFEWWERRGELDIGEMIRHVRSVSIRTQFDLERLRSALQVRELMGEDIFAAYTLFHEWILYRREAILTRLELHVQNAIQSDGKRWRRCLAALLIIDANLTRLADVLLICFERETDPYAKGEMGFALGRVGSRRHALDLLAAFAVLSPVTFNMEDDREWEALLNDLALGLRTAFKRRQLLDDDVETCQTSMSPARYTLLSRVLDGTGVDPLPE
jgi:hypothetical protein